MLARFIVMWLIALALPIQGVAAATMLHCGSAQAEPAVQTHGHGHAHHASGNDHADHTAHAKHGHGHSSAGKAGCSACASCCSAAALPAMALVMASQEPAPTGTAPPPHPVVVFLTDGPERPPRNFLA